MSVRIVLADDHVIFREGLAELLAAEGFDVVGQASTTTEALKLLQELRPDLALLDVHMPVAPAAHVVTTARRLAPETRIAMLSMHNDPNVIDELLALGAHGYFSKTLSRRELCDGLTALLASSQAITMVPQPASPRLEPGERRLLSLLVGGATNKELASALYVSEASVKRILRRLYGKIGAGSRVEAALWASRMGIEPSHAKDEPPR